MVKSPRSSYTKTTKRVARSLDDLLRDIPLHVFTSMVTKSGLSAEDSRELCRLFKELK